ncbi:hypothetical protein DL93DRAFT_138704 [Clavulina sp. PMI_390]|nr:hypothetical protein DL93DRAFT_138704 [Clavulina sp. PMI_390]
MFQRLFSAFGARISKRANSQQSDPAGRLTVEYESDSDAYGTEHAPSLPSDFDQSQDIDPNDVSLPQTSLSSELSTNGLRGGLRLIRPRAYNPREPHDLLSSGDSTHPISKNALYSSLLTTYPERMVHIFSLRAFTLLTKSTIVLPSMVLSSTLSVMRPCNLALESTT